MMVPTQRIFQDNIIILMYHRYALTLRNACLLIMLFRMRTADDLRNNLLMVKNDIDEHYKLLVPDIRNGLVLYMNNIDQTNFIIRNDVGFKAGTER